MIEVIFSAIITGILLSLFLIGPVFFLLIETSLTKGHRAAVILDFGVISADILCIIVAYYSSKDMKVYIKDHPSLYVIGGFILIIYGIFMILSKGRARITGNKLITTNYFKTFINGFLLNLVNVGVVVFWISTVLLIRTQFGNKNFEFFLFISITLITLIIIDLCKIFLAQLLKKFLTNDLVKKIKKIMGLVLVIFGTIFFLKSFKPKFIEKIDQKIEENIHINN